MPDTFKKHKAKITKDLKALGTYKPEFSTVIDKLAETMRDYDEAVLQWADAGGTVVVVQAGSKGQDKLVKSPFLAAVESLRGQALTYMRDLGLTPAGYKNAVGKLEKEKPKSKLDAFLGAAP